MKAIRLLVMLTVAVLSSVSGYAYEPLVQEGLVWNTSHEEHEDNGKPYKVIDSWYFDAPVEMYGKTYHSFKHKDHIFGYMRQEGDKVYLLVDGENISDIGYYNENDDWVELSTGDEVLIYDFGAKVGDKYMTVSMDGYGSFYANPEMIEVYVVKADTVIVNGHERKRQYLSPFVDWPETQHIAVEGVGINIGAVHLPQYILLPSLDPNIDVFHLDSMTDADGNVLFTRADFNTPTLTREPLVREGVTWNHTEASIYPGSYDSFDSYSFYFDSPVELYGKMYHPLKDRRSESGEVFAYMRQEGNKVYILIDGESVIPPFETMSGEEFAAGDELLLYDFDAKTGDEYWSPSVSDSMTMPYIEALVRVTVTNVDTILVNGVLRKRLMTKANGGGSPEINIVEGIGPSRGYMHIPLYGPLCTCQHTTDAFVKDIVDAEGNVIFKAADFDAPAYSAGVPEVGFDTGGTRIVDNKMYDLNGREIRNPLPGTVYIQNGEKHVAK